MKWSFFFEIIAKIEYLNEQSETLKIKISRFPFPKIHIRYPQFEISLLSLFPLPSVKYLSAVH